MIEEIKYKEVEIIEPEYVEYFMLMCYTPSDDLGYKWFCCDMSSDIEWINKSMKNNKESDKKWRPDGKKEYKILSIKLKEND